VADWLFRHRLNGKSLARHFYQSPLQYRQGHDKPRLITYRRRCAANTRPAACIATWAAHPGYWRRRCRAFHRAASRFHCQLPSLSWRPPQAGGSFATVQCVSAALSQSGRRGICRPLSLGSPQVKGKNRCDRH